jgi:hypothetical protein
MACCMAALNACVTPAAKNSERLNPSSVTVFLILLGGRTQAPTLLGTDMLEGHAPKAL